MIYYAELAKYLNAEGVNAEDMFPYSEFVSLMEKDRVYGMLQGVLGIYHVLHQEVKVTHGPNYRKTWQKIWMNSPDVLTDSFDKIQRLKHRIVESLLELYSCLMVGEASDSEGSDDPISLGDEVSEGDESSDVSIESGLRMQSDDDDIGDDEEEEQPRGQMLINFVIHQ